MTIRQLKLANKFFDKLGTVLGAMGMIVLCTGEWKGLIFIVVGFAALIAANRLYDKAHPDRGSKKDKYYSIKQV